MDKPVDRRIRRTEIALRKAFAKLLQRKPAREITVTELCELADIQRATFYLHYRDVFDLQAEIENEIIRKLTAILCQAPSEKPEDRPRIHLQALLRYAADNADLCRAFLSDHGDMAFFQKLCKVAREQCLREVKDATPSDACGGDLAQKQIPLYEYFGHYSVSGCVGVIRHWLDTGMKESPEEVAEIAGRIAAHGIQIFLHSDID